MHHAPMHALARRLSLLVVLVGGLAFGPPLLFLPASARGASASRAARAPVSRELSRDATLLEQAVDRLAAAGDDSDFELLPDGDRVILRLPARLLFDPDSEQPRSDAAAMRLLSVPAQLLKRRRLLVLQISVYTDNIGGDNFNQTRAVRRARALVAVLVRDGVAGTRLEARGMGVSDAVASNDTPLGRDANRRVEFLFQRADRTAERTGTRAAPATSAVRPERAAAPAGA